MIKRLSPLLLVAALGACDNAPETDELVEAGYTPETSSTITCLNEDGSIAFSEEISDYNWAVNTSGNYINIETMPATNSSETGLPSFRSVFGCIAETSYVAETELSIEQPYNVSATINGESFFSASFSNVLDRDNARLLVSNETENGIRLGVANIMNLPFSATPN